ncbi:DUF2919 domain-containing protein [Vibrio pectenicida]|uniref:DUF2919 domain-containing protein n=1 Tax=Vibrio pectenicida TaxID=62763 RepID=UPI00148C0979
MVRYSLEQYDKHGFLKAPLWLWLGWLFLAKAWVIFTLAGASRENGGQILDIIYPDHNLFYLDLLMGVPSLVLMWAIGLRSPDRTWINRVVGMARSTTLLVITGQFIQTIYHVYLEHGIFQWSNAVALVILLWFMLYTYKSRHVRDCLGYTSSVAD